MATHESRIYKLAKVSLLALLLAALPIPGDLRGQAAAAAINKEPKEDPLSVLFKKAELNFDQKKYKDALADYVELEKQATSVEDKLKAVVIFRKATCYYLIKDWSKTEIELTNFLTKFPRGTDDFFDSDNRRGLAELTLIEVLSNQAKWDAALLRLEKIRSNTLARPEDRVNAYALSAKIVLDRVKSAPEADKKAAYGQAIALLKQATSEGVNTPERKEAGYKLVEIYTKLGLVKDADQLKSEIDAKSSGSPADIVRSNFQRLSIGDARFASAEATVDENTQPEAYRQALNNYQGTLRRATLTRALVKAVEAKQGDLDNITKNNPKPNDETKAKIEMVRQDLDQFKKIEAEFNANKDYDAFISYRIGLCLLELNRPWEAFVAFRDIFDNNPEFSRITGTYYYYIVALRRTGRNAEAQAKCKEFLGKFPKADENSAIGIILGEISQDTEDFKEAIAHYRWVKDNVKNLTVDAAMEIDFRIACCHFAMVDWNDARVAFDKFLKQYPHSPVTQQVLYMNALCWFYQGKFKETKAAFDTYEKEYPRGQFLPDVRYRQAIVKFGSNPPETTETLRLCNEWLKEFAVLKTDEVINQLPEVHTLIGDTYIRLADQLTEAIRLADLDIRNSDSTNGKNSAAANKAKLEKQKNDITSKAVDAYVTAARTGRTNPSALEFVLRELGKMLPGRGEHQRMRDLYKEIYDWNHNDPKAMTYLFDVIKSTERMGDKVEFSQRTEQTTKNYSAKLAVARKAVTDLERNTSTTEAIAGAKEAVTKLSAQLAAELDVIEKERQSSITKAKSDALKILSNSVTESINDRRQEGAEKLIIFLTEKIAKKVKRVKPGTKPDPAAYSVDNAEAELKKLLRLEENRDSLIAQARGFFALGQLAINTRNPEKAASYFEKIATSYKAEELSPTIIAVVGDHLLAKGELTKAASYFDYIREHSRSTDYADYGFAGSAEILLRQKKFKQAAELCQEAIDNNILMSKEREIRFVHGRALVELGQYVAAKKTLEDIAKTKEWRGETTAGCLYWLGLAEERQSHDAEAVAYYRRCWMAWKKYEVWSAKAYLSAAKILGNKMGQKPEAKAVLLEMLSNERIKATPEANEAKELTLSL